MPVLDIGSLWNNIPSIYTGSPKPVISRLTLCNSYRYTVHSDKKLPAPGHREILPNRIEGWDPSKARWQAAFATVRSRQRQTAARHERFRMEAASASGGAQKPVGCLGKRELASDV